MGKIILIALLGLVSCTGKNEYRYEIHGELPTSLKTTNKAIWFTDTVSYDQDTIYYFNSDGSEVRIKPPYILIDKTLKNK
jgi:hypothetical protein